VDAADVAGLTLHQREALHRFRSWWQHTAQAQVLATVNAQRAEIAAAAGLEPHRQGVDDAERERARRRHEQGVAARRQRGIEAREMERMVCRRGARQPAGPTVAEDAETDANIAAALERLRARAYTP
jgi:hypothetical protein